jgi:hypothetical protein
MNTRTKQILGAVATIVVLATVVLAAWAFTSPRNTRAPLTVQLDAQRQSRQAYEEGLKDIRSGDTTAAVVAFTSAIQLDPTNSAAKTALADLEKSRADAPPGAEGASPPGPASPATSTQDPFARKVGNIEALLPRAYAGFSLGTPIAEEANAELGATPSSGGAISHIQWAVHDRGSTSGAAKFVTDVSKSLYGKNAASVKVNGVNAYFGTDGARFASVSYSRGRYVFEVVLTVSAADLANSKTVATQAASAFPTKP